MANLKRNYSDKTSNGSASCPSLEGLKRRRALLQDKIQFWQNSIQELKKTGAHHEKKTTPTSKTPSQLKEDNSEFISQLLKANDVFTSNVHQTDLEKTSHTQPASTYLAKSMHDKESSHTELTEVNFTSLLKKFSVDPIRVPAGLDLFHPLQLHLIDSKSLSMSLRSYNFLGSCKLFSFSIDLKIEEVPSHENPKSEAEYTNISSLSLTECTSSSLVRTMSVHTSPWVCRETKAWIDAATNSNNLLAVMHGLSEYAILCETRSQIFDSLETKFSSFLTSNHASIPGANFGVNGIDADRPNDINGSYSPAHLRVTRRSINLRNNYIELTICWHILFDDHITGDPASKVFLVVSTIASDDTSADGMANWNNIADKSHDIFDSLIKRYGVFRASCIITDILLA
ncbi:hypothetical protein NADFUDRAFT_51387 [Nadsonia fulvescens var. elongata DSM 6958]|uniref:Uncharacterized protein n=1 Tax=Nadsonia fulvescens var. elongata DSM 6958 TaxID=857566 RepID=A0A1E3PL08_9ASCO|nr:hypothetical protein NADFUDRAFT_51387 [Nadsonia fulvescens var. elongata DSM 6958]